MKYILFLLLLTAPSCYSVAQVYQTGRRSITFTDPSRNGRAINTELYYPANSTGNNLPIATGNTKFPVVVFGHGFVIPYSSYTWLADSLVKYGYIAALPTTESSFSPSHEQFGKDLAFLCQYIFSLNDSANSFLFGRVSNRSAVGGHSMGGGSSFLATGYHNGINAIFNFAAAETNPSAKNAALHVQLPALIFSGSADCIVPDSNQLRLYNNVPYPCKSFINITNGLHCHFANNDGTCATGQFLSGCNSSSITAQAVFQKTATLLVPFLDYYLKDSCGSRGIFDNRLAAMTGVNKEQSCLTDPFICSASSTLFEFTGTGNWDVAGNWTNGTIPPLLLPPNASIIINPSGNTDCVLNVIQTISAGASLKVTEGKNFVVQGNLTILR